MEVIQLAKKEAKVVGRPIDSQLLEYLFLRAAYATHGKSWEELNMWLSEITLDEIEMANLYQELVLRKHEVDLVLKFSTEQQFGNTVTCQDQQQA